MKKMIKDSTIELLEISDINLLVSFYGLSKDQITKQPRPEINPISWIYGHCISHLDFIYGELCLGSRILPREVSKLVSYGATKGEVLEGLPISFKELVEFGLQISNRTFSYLEKLPEEKFYELPEKDFKKKSSENIIKVTQRVALHLMGHMGQIVLIRRLLGDPGSGFVGGMNGRDRAGMKERWTKWWEENKSSYK